MDIICKERVELYDVVGIDCPCIDMLAHIATLPKANESTLVLENSWQGGGKVATGVVAASRLGLSAAIMGTVGDDIYGKFCINDFIRHEVDIQCLYVRKDSSTSFSIVLSDKETNSRSILYKLGSVEPLQPEEINFDYIKNSKVLHIAQAQETHLAAAKFAKEHGVQVVYDADNFSKEMEKMFPYIDIFIASEFVYNHYFGNSDDYKKNLKLTLSKGPKAVVYTFGSKGCVGMMGKEYFNLPAFKVPVKDTVGAGDVFHGAFVYGLCQNWGFEETAEFASAVSAIKCTRIGGRAGIPTKEMVFEFIKSGKIDNDSLDERVKFYERGIENV